jgi:hypothetical protein
MVGCRHRRGFHFVPLVTSALLFVAGMPQTFAYDRNPWAAPSDRPDSTMPGQRYQEGRFVAPSYDPASPPRQEAFRSWDPMRPGASGPVFIDPSLRFAPGSGLPTVEWPATTPGRPPAYGVHPYPGVLGTPTVSPYLYPGMLLYPGTGWLAPGFSPLPGIPGTLTPYGMP